MERHLQRVGGEPARVGHAARQRLALRRVIQQAQPVAQPLDRGAGHEHRALQRVGELAGAVHPGHRGQQPSGRAHHGGPGVGQHEGPGPVRALGVARAEAGLPEQGGLLVAVIPGHRDVQAEERQPGSVRATTPVDGTTSGSARCGTRSSSAVPRTIPRPRGRASSSCRW